MKSLAFVIKNTAAVLFTVALLFYASACTKEQNDKIGILKNRTALPQVQATNITTVISDSGVTRYRIYTKQWNMFDQAAEPYWDFPKGIHFERFNEDLKVDANIHANKAKYFERQKLWELRGKVRAINILGEMFESERLFWNQNDKRIYSDTIVKITRQTSIINAINFEANESLTKYSGYQVHGPMVVQGE